MHRIQEGQAVPYLRRVVFAIALCTCPSIGARADEPDRESGARKTAEKPQAFRYAEEARASHRLRTGRLEMVEHIDLPNIKSTRFRTWKCAGDDVIVVDHGDEEGVAQRDAETGLPSTHDYPGPMSFLVQGGRIWWHDEDSPLARNLPRERRDFFNLWDFRRLGLDPGTPGESIEARAAAHGVAREYSEGWDGKLAWVKSESASGSTTWWIDPERDWNVVRSATEVLGKHVVDVRYTLGEIDGVWFPVRVEHYDLDVDPAAPTRITEVVAAEFNRPDHPQRFTPADVGIEVGTQINYLDPDPRVQMENSGWWDGHSVISFSEYVRRLDSGELVRGPTVARAIARLRERAAARAAAAAAVSTQPTTSTTQPASFDPLGQWERYTLSFIERHGLDDGQRERALAILRDCRDMGNVHLVRARERIARWEERRRQMAESRSPNAAESDALERERRQIADPLDRIFEERLKPRLDALLTTGQRKAAP